MIAGPAYCAAADPVKTKMPAPMIAPIPKVTRLIGPSARFRLCSPDSPASFVSTSSDFVANKGLPMQLLLHMFVLPVYPETANLDAAIVVATAPAPYKKKLLSRRIFPRPEPVHGNAK